MEATLPRSLNKPGIVILGRRELRQFQGQEAALLGAAIDEMGKRSMRAQGLRKPITTWASVQNSEHRTVLSIDRGCIRGLLRVGERNLFVRSQLNAAYSQIAPTCVLDFYVHESCQRQGDGRRLFDAMLQHEGLQAHQLAYDRPSKKLIAFCKRHFGLRDYPPQDNNFVLFDEFWTGSAADPLRRQRAESAPDGIVAHGRRAGGSVRRLREQVAAAAAEPPGQQQQQQQQQQPPRQLPNKHSFIMPQQTLEHTLQPNMQQEAPPPPPQWQLEYQQYQQQQQQPAQQHAQQHTQQHMQPESQQQPLSPEGTAGHLSGRLGGLWGSQPGQHAPVSLAQPPQPPVPVSNVQSDLFGHGGRTSKLAAAHSAHAAHGWGPRGNPLALRQPATVNHQASAGGVGFGGGYHDGGSYHDRLSASRDEYRRELEARQHRRPF